MSADTFVGRAEEAAGYGRRALARFRALDDPWGRIQALFQLGMLSRVLGDRAGAEALLREALAGARRDGPSWVVAGCLLELGSLAAELGDLAEASRLHQESTTLARRAGLRRGLTHAANEAGIVARAAGDLARARRLHLEALGILREAVPFRVPRALALVAAAEVRLGDLDQAARHLGEASRASLDPATWRAASEHGRASAPRRPCGPRSTWPWPTHRAGSGRPVAQARDLRRCGAFPWCTVGFHLIRWTTGRHAAGWWATSASLARTAA